MSNGAMLLYANGCSMTRGDELAEPQHGCFPALIADHFGYGLLNQAYSGSSNCRILRTTLLWIADYLGKGGDPAELFVLIGWTAPDRREFALAEEEGTLDPDLFWRDIFVHCQLDNASPDLLRLHELVFSAFACDRESMMRFLVAATSLQGFLASCSIRYCFTHTMPFPAPHPELAPLVDSIDASRFHRFLKPQSDFLSACHAPWRARIGANNHPLEEGHRQWADELIEFIKQGNLL